MDGNFGPHSEDYDVRDPVIDYALSYLVQTLNCQVASIYLFSKKAN